MYAREARVMRSVLLTIVFVVLTGQARAELAVTLSTEQITVIETGIQARLKNPDSAKFSRLVARTIIGTVLAVCGYVNAKNSSGSYIGNLAFDGFLSNNDSWRFSVLAIDDPSHISAQQTCHDWGLF
jgi:hypothetical protein